MKTKLWLVRSELLQHLDKTIGQEKKKQREFQNIPCLSEHIGRKVQMYIGFRKLIHYVEFDEEKVWLRCRWKKTVEVKDYLPPKTEVMKRLVESAKRTPLLRRMTKKQLMDEYYKKVWGDMDVFTEQSDIAEEVFERMRYGGNWRLRRLMAEIWDDLRKSLKVRIKNLTKKI